MLQPGYLTGLAENSFMSFSMPYPGAGCRFLNGVHLGAGASSGYGACLKKNDIFYGALCILWMHGGFKYFFGVFNPIVEYRFIFALEYQVERCVPGEVFDKGIHFFA